MSRRKAMPWITPSSCEGCASCVGSCTRGCLVMRPYGEEEGVFIPWIENPSECAGCGLCAEACVWGGIAMTTHVEEAEHRLLEHLKPHRGKPQ